MTPFPIFVLARIAYGSIFLHWAIFCRDFITAMTIATLGLLPFCLPPPVALFSGPALDDIYFLLLSGMKVILPIPLMVSWSKIILPRKPMADGSPDPDGASARTIGIFSFGSAEWRMLGLVISLLLLISFASTIAFPLLSSLGMTRLQDFSGRPLTIEMTQAFFADMQKAFIAATLIIAPLLARICLAAPAIASGKKQALAYAFQISKGRSLSLIGLVFICWGIPFLLLDKGIFILVMEARMFFEFEATHRLLIALVSVAWSLLHAGALVALLATAYRFLHKNEKA